MTIDYLAIEKIQPIDPHPQLRMDNYKVTEAYELSWESRDLEAIVQLNPEGHGLIQFTKRDGSIYAGPLVIFKTDIEERRVPAPCECTKERHWIKPPEEFEH